MTELLYMTQWKNPSTYFLFFGGVLLPYQEI